MSDFFDESEYDTSLAEEAVQEASSGPNGSPTDADDLMNEAVKRFKLASYYMEIMKGSIFKDGSEEAILVDREIRDFARNRMEILIGVKQEAQAPTTQVELPFNDEEIQALKALAAKVMHKPALVSPTVTKPELNTIAPPKIGPAPKAQQSAPINKAPNKVQNKPQTPKTDKIPTCRTEAQAEAISDGQPFRLKGKVYKWVVSEVDAIGRYKKDITPQSKNNDIRPIPVPTDSELVMVTERMSQGSATATEKRMGDINKIAAALNIKNG